MSNDEIDRLVVELGASLNPAQYAAFVAAADAAIAGLTCPGPGLVYRLLASLQHQFFDPPLEEIGPRFSRVSKLRDGAPIEHADGRRRYRKLQAVG
jgi:hypothetical protein